MHDERISAGVFNHVSGYVADVVWRGISTQHVRAGLEGAVDFTLASGVRLTSRLVLDTQVAGPWEAGPLAVTAAGDQATVVNRC